MTFTAVNKDVLQKTSRIAIVTGSWKAPSKTRVLAEALAHRLSVRRHIAISRIDLAEAGGQVASLTSRNGLAPETAALFAAVESADLLIVGSPIFKASYTGLFKHFFDLIDPAALSGTPVALTATGGSDRHALALEHQFRPLFGFFNAPTLPTTVYAVESDFVEGVLIGSTVLDRIERAAAEAARELDRIAAERPFHKSAFDPAPALQPSRQGIHERS